MPDYYDDPYYYGGYYGGPFWPRDEVVETEKSSNLKKAGMLEKNEHSSFKTATSANVPEVEEASVPIAVGKDAIDCATVPQTIPQQSRSKDFEESSRRRRQIEEESHRRQRVSAQKDYGDDQDEGEDGADDQGQDGYEDQDDSESKGMLSAKGRYAFAAGSIECA